MAKSQPRDRYTFFMKGTQLTQLMESYDEIEEHVEKLKKTCVGQKDVITDRKQKLDHALVRYEQAQKARGLEEEKMRLQGEMAWAHVATKADEVKENMITAKKAEKKLEAREKKLREKHEEIVREKHMERMSERH